MTLLGAIQCSSESLTTGCRFCGGHLHEFLDLGMSPLCQTIVTEAQRNRMEPFFPLRLSVCGACHLVQLPEYVAPETIFTEYAYFSSYSDSYVEHGRAYARMIAARLGLGRDSRVVELASNDGYLLQHFLAQGIPVLGVEPAVNVAQVAIQKGIPTEIAFFGREKAAEMRRHGRVADLIIGNNVLAQVPDINSFVAGIKILLAPQGVATIEFPHLLVMLRDCLYDTVYHEHFSYFSLIAVQAIFARHGLRIFDVEEIWTHGGSLRIYLCHADSPEPTRDTVPAILAREASAGLHDIATYEVFAERVKESKRSLLAFLLSVKRAGRSVAGYGAPGKGNTLLNYCGVRTDFIDYTVDRNPYKQGKYLPGTHIPVYPPERIAQTKPDYVLILPWNLKEEIVEQLAEVRGWGGKFVIAVPVTTVFD